LKINIKIDKVKNIDSAVQLSHGSIDNTMCFFQNCPDFQKFPLLFTADDIQDLSAA
jgi:hypothetical protein